MPFDGVVVKCIADELTNMLVGGRVEKIFQPEADEIMMSLRSKGQNLKLVLSVSASYPRIHITDAVKENPAVPPVFCMLLRKHLSGGKIMDIEFHDFERIVSIHIESMNELGDVSIKRLIIEIMGRYSNIILVNSEDKIIDAIKHVDSEVSSVREVMPARPYVLPPAQDKTSPLELDIDSLIDSAARDVDTGIENYLLSNIKGFSPLLCKEACYRSEIDGRHLASELSFNALERLKKSLKGLIGDISMSRFTPCIIYSEKDRERPTDFHCVNILQNSNVNYLQSMSLVLDTFYSTKDRLERLKQKKADLLKVLKNNIDRCNKKLALQREKLRDVADREKLKLYGELITANIYCIPRGLKSISLLNYYSENGEYIDISLDENRSPQENAQRYFKQYSKAKSTFTYTNQQLGENLKELEYLEGVLHLLDNCTSLQEIGEVRQELIDQNYIHSKKIGQKKKKDSTSVPLHFISSDGLDIYVGKNNRQNDLLTLKSASSNDIWLHTRNIPGSHVIIKKTREDIPARTLLEAALLAAFHSKFKNSSNVPVDYTTVKNVNKPSGAKPGMVIYDNFKTIVVTPDEEKVKMLKAEK